MRHFVIIFVSFLFVVGCNGRASSGGVVRSFGVSSCPDGSKTLEVTRREKSLVDFEVVEAASGRTLARDHMGSDAMRWFLYWEDATRMWGYGSDMGYFKLFEFQSNGTVSETTVEGTMAVPQVVWENLPYSMQRKQKVRQE